MTVGMKYLSGRSIHMIGSVVLCLAYVISSRAEDVRVLLLSFGVIKGMQFYIISHVKLMEVLNCRVLLSENPFSTILATATCLMSSLFIP